MPMYEFACSHCGHVFEKIRRLSDEGAPLCPNCGSTETQKKISGFAVGSGGANTVAPPPSRGFT